MSRRRVVRSPHTRIFHRHNCVGSPDNQIRFKTWAVNHLRPSPRESDGTDATYFVGFVGFRRDFRLQAKRIVSGLASLSSFPSFVLLYFS